MLITRYDIDVQPGGALLNVWTSQYDVKSRQFVFTVVNSDEGAEFELPEGVQAEVRGTKPDGNGFSYEAGIDGYDVTVEITEQMTAIAGKVRCELILYKGTPGAAGYYQIGTANFIMNVERAALDADTLKSNSEIRQLVEVMNNSAQIIAAGAQVEGVVANVQGYVQEAIDAAQAAKLSALEASNVIAGATSAIEREYMADVAALQDQLNSAIAEALGAMATWKTSTASEMSASYTENMDAVMEKFAEILGIKTVADNTAAQAVTIAQGANTNAVQALEKATTAENDMAEMGTQMEQLRSDSEMMILKMQDFINGAYVENGVGYFTHDGQVIFEMTGMGGGGGGGGADTGNNAVIRIENLSGWMSKTISKSDDATCPVTFNWTSLENEMATGNGSLAIKVSGAVKGVLEVPQGNVTIDVARYLSVGPNTVSLTVTDIYGNNRTINMTVTVVELTLSSTFDDSTTYNGAISYPYTPTGSVSKTVHFILDDAEIGTQTTSVSGRQQSFTIPQQSHGAHTLRVYFEANVNGQVVQSNELYYEIICIDPLNTNPIIVSGFKQTTALQYESVLIEYSVYDPMNLEAEVAISVNGTVAQELVADRTKHTFSYRIESPGTLTIVIATGEVSKTFVLTVSESDIHPEAVTDQLALHLTAAGRSNSEANPAVWEYGTGANKISASFTGFNWVQDGWVMDENNETCLRVMGGSQVTIPYLPYASDFVVAGKCIEIEFAVHDVMDYDSTIISCLDGGRGFDIKTDNAAFKSTRGDVTCKYSVDTHLRLTLDVQSRSANRLMYLFIDGEIQGVKQYSGSTGSFAQVTPVGITIGSANAAVDIYSIRVYDRFLTPTEVLGNYIADRQDVFDMLNLFRTNDIFDDSGNVVISKLTTALPTLPYGIFEGEQSPQYKGDKKTVVFDFWDTASNVQRTLSAQGVQIDGQGTSSQYYAVKNWKIKLKNGVTVNGVLMAGFTIREGEIMVSEFTLKANVASSENANNDLLEKLYNDLSKELGILTPPQRVNSAVRVGIDGFPCVFFWDYGDGPEFVGMYNFNNDKGTFDTFGFSEGDEAWDVRNNSSLLSKFKTATLNSDWYTEDYESIYPEDYSDSSRILPMTQFIHSTWQDAATNENLPSAVTYGGVQYTKDTAAYRLAKFKAEFPNWYDLDNQAFYYVFTLVFLMVDSRQKNEHITYWNSMQKWWDLIWDCDTALGNDNRGKLGFEYWMEDGDVDERGENVFNGADNVKWMNFKQAFWAQAAAMYQRMRSTGKLNTEYLKAMFNDWQAAWCKALWNEDNKFKYTNPLVKDNDSQYLDMAYGSKRWQRDEFIEWRIPYMDSLFDVGDALLSIMFRPYYEVTEAQRAAGAVDITIDVYKKSYVTVLWDSTKTTQRCVDGYSCVVHNPLSYASDSVVGIHNAKMIRDVHGLENLYVGFWDSSNAPNLQGLRLGSNAAGYVNRATQTVSVGTNKKLRVVDLRNCVNFGKGDQKTVDLSHCPNIQKIYLDGTAALGVELPNGGVIDELHLPDTVTSIVLRNHPKLLDEYFVVEDFDNVDQLWLEGMTGLDTLGLLREVPAGTAVRITGFYWEAADAAEIEGIFDLLDTMRGIDINGQGQGEEVQTAQISGTIHTAALTGAQIAGWKARYPSINVVADHTASYVTFKTWDGGSIIETVTYSDGRPTKALPTVPNRAQTNQYDFQAVGWNRNMDASTANFDANTLATEDCTVYAAYSRTVRKYTVTWKNADGTTLETDTNVPYGTMPTYNGATPTYNGQTARGWTPAISAVTGNVTYTASYIPTYTATFVLAAADGGTTLYTQNNVPQGTTPTYGGATPVSTRGNDYTFAGWSPALSGIQANTTYTAVFDSPVKGSIEDSWEEIIAAGANGTYASKYNIGDTKEISLGTEGKVLMVLVGKNVDPLASGGGNAPMTWISQELLKTTHRWNPSASDTTEGTGTYGGWEKCELRTYLRETIMPLIPATVRNAIKPVTKYSRIYSSSTGNAETNVASTETVWIPGRNEMFGGYSGESNSPYYSSAFPDNASRVKKNVSTGTAAWWWLRSAYITSYANNVNSDGSFNYYYVFNGSGGVALGFCL